MGTGMLHRIIGRNTWIRMHELVSVYLVPTGRVISGEVHWTSCM